MSSLGQSLEVVRSELLRLRRRREEARAAATESENELRLAVLAADTAGVRRSRIVEWSGLARGTVYAWLEEAGHPMREEAGE